jgi:hypothetical protein
VETLAARHRWRRENAWELGWWDEIVRVWDWLTDSERRRDARLSVIGPNGMGRSAWTGLGGLFFACLSVTGHWCPSRLPVFLLPGVTTAPHSAQDSSSPQLVVVIHFICVNPHKHARKNPNARNSHVSSKKIADKA